MKSNAILAGSSIVIQDLAVFFVRVSKSVSGFVAVTLCSLASQFLPAWQTVSTGGCAAAGIKLIAAKNINKVNRAPSPITAGRSIERSDETHEERAFRMCKELSNFFAKLR